MPPSKRRRQQSNKKGPTPRMARSASTIGDDVSPVVERGSSMVGSGPMRSAPQSGVPASARYTPKFKARGPFRPTWHKVLGAFIIVLGLSIFVINDLAWFDINIIPGGHNELWAVVGIGIAATSTWWFGWFDRPPGQPRR